MRDVAASSTSRWHGLLALSLLFATGDPEAVLAARITIEPEGFNGYTWGSPTTDYPALQPVTNPAVAQPLPFVEVFENPGEALTLNGVQVSPVYYRFYKGRLGNIQVAFEGRANREKLLKWIEANFGKLPPAEHKQKQIEWHGNNVVITLGYDVLTGQGRLWFTYLPLSPFDNSTTDTSGY